MRESKASIAMIDDDATEIGQLSELLNMLADEKDIKLQFVAFSPQTNEQLENIVNEILRDSYTGIILDQKLGDMSGISYIGTEITKKIRIQQPFIPIYILTKYVGDQDVDENAFSLEDTLKKISIADDSAVILPRMARASMRYAMHMRAEAERIRSLLEQSFSRELTPEEHKEFNHLRVQAMLPELSDIIAENDTKEGFMSVFDGINLRLDSIIRKLDNED